jgi:hypothetical protein
MGVGKRVILSWDVGAIIEEEVKHRLEEWTDFYDEKPDEDTVRESITNYDTSFEWECLVDELTELMSDKSGYWRAEVKGFGWQGIDGIAYFKATDGAEFLKNILPKTDCTFYIHKYGKGFAIQNFHHDSPTGNEWYYVVPIAYSTYIKGKNG